MNSKRFQELRDADGSLVGIVENLGSVQILKTKKGNTIGSYDSGKNLTFKADGEVFGKGNWLLALITSWS